MSAGIAADALVLVHVAFIGFVLLGAILVAHDARWAAAHVPAVVWAVLVEWNGWVCPLTPWEQALRQAAGQGGYEGSFVDHYVLPILYPAGLTATIQIYLAVVAVFVNAIGYALAVRAWRLRRRR